jgi:ATP-dependent DNA helicase RecG
MELGSLLKDVLRTTWEHLRALEEMEIRTVGELLLYLPRGHEDLSQLQTIAGSPLGEKVSLRGTIEDLRLVRIRGGKYLVQATFTDTEGGAAEVVWFNQPHIKRMISDGQEVVLTGKLQEKGMKLQLLSPQFEIASDRPLLHAGRLVPIYPQHGCITSKWLREKITLVKPAIANIEENLPQEVIEEEHLLSRADAVRAMHFPEDPVIVERARERFAFEHMYSLQRDALGRKQEWQSVHQDRLKTPMDAELIRQFFASLKFTPTASQKIAIYEILRDLEKDCPMSRLLEGDVGSGKTLVAVAVMANVVQAGGQCALMVPTEVLARQHVETVTRLLLNFSSFMASTGSARFSMSPTVALLTGSVPPGEATAIKESLAAGMVKIVVGTHALIEEDVTLKDLRLVIVDEQHRFGVLQRKRLLAKGSPHFLSMTATPIPRTLALTAYGDHDLSVLLEKPGNRKVIRTKVVAPSARRTVELFIDREIDAGRQVFVICPLIEGSDAEEMADVRSVEAEVERLRRAFPRRRISALHGRMSAQEKQSTMRAFKAKEFDILVSTSVIEVGVDVPNATIMVIEGAERFGLAQLHQFRGRVGRSDSQSHCFLFATTPQHARSVRLKAMEQYDSGFQLAEIDLKLRGPGELFGLRQSGIVAMPFSTLYNPALIVRARRAAEKQQEKIQRT